MDIQQPFVTQEQKVKFWTEAKAEIARLQERLITYDKWLSEGVYYTTAEAFELHDGYNSKNAQLQIKIGDVTQQYQEKLNDAEDKLAQLQADNLKLREALAWALGCVDVGSWIESGDMKPAVDAFSKASAVLNSTPAQSLQDHDDEVIERTPK